MELEDVETRGLREKLDDSVLLDDEDEEAVPFKDLLKIGEALPPVAVIDAMTPDGEVDEVYVPE